MKKKLLVLTLCFTLVFCSLNLKKSYADGGVISLPVLATVSALAVGTGIILNSSDDIYDIGYLFKNWVDKHNSITWDTVNLAFSSVVALPNKYVSVDSEFLGIVKTFFDDTFNDDYNGSFASTIPIMKSYDHSLSMSVREINKKLDTLYIGDFTLQFEDNYVKVYYNGDLANPYRQAVTTDNLTDVRIALTGYGSSSYPTLVMKGYKGSYLTNFTNVVMTKLAFDSMGVVDFPYNGGYSWDNVESKKENESVALPVPGNLGDLVGQSSDSFWSNSDNLVGNSDLSIPSVSNPSISLDNTISFPNTNVDTDNPGIDTDIPDTSLPVFPSWGDGLNLSPITQSNIGNKFPFCLAKDLGDLISIFDVEEKEPIFEVACLGETYVFDFTPFQLWADIVKFFIFVGYIFGLIKLTRGIIG